MLFRSVRSARRARGTPFGWGLLAAALALGLVFGPGRGIGAALEVPPAGGFYIQTSGPNAGVGIGDWYSSTVAGAGAGYHYVEITVPCGWPAATPLHLDLFSPEMNAVAASTGRGDEQRNVLDSTEFELYGPGASVGPGYANPGPGTGIAGSRVTFAPGAPGVPEAWVRYWTLSPVACGEYLLRSAVILPQADDDNGWRLRVGFDTDGDPTNAPPATLSNPDGIPGTNDELVVGQVQITYQHDTGGVACLTLYEYIAPGLPSVTFHNFDMDGNTRVRYYAPSDAFDPTGLTGGTPGTLNPTSGQWNQGTIARGGDTLASPEPGWWRVVSCLSSTNQFIQEAQAGVGAYFEQPPIPALVVGKSDGLAEATPGDTLTYTVALANTASGPTAGAAHAVVVSDQLPSGTTFVGCAFVAPASGSCSQSAGVVTANLAGWLNAGAAASVEITVTVDLDASGSLTDVATVTYADGLGNPFPTVTASDVDVLLPGLPNTSLAASFQALALAAVAGIALAVAIDLNVRSNRRRRA